MAFSAKKLAMHCTNAACVTVCPSGALYNKEFGTVGMDRTKCIGCKECVAACPFEIPKYDSKTSKVYKCDMCESRITNNMEPACVKSCPTGALKWGEKDKMLALAQKLWKKLAVMRFYDQFVNGTHFMYVLKEGKDVYADIHENPKVPLSVIYLERPAQALSLLGAGGVIGGSLLHYILHGPKRPDPEPGDDVKTEGRE